MVLPSGADRRVFIDTSAYYALADARDNEHGRAIIIASRLARGRWSLTTTNFALPRRTPWSRNITAEQQGRPFTMEDPFWKIVGIGASAGATDVSTNKHKYLADAIMQKRV